MARLTPAGTARWASDGAWKLFPHLAAVNRLLLHVAAGALRRLIVMLPPRHGKSELVSRFVPAWFLGNHPTKRVILAGYEHEFAASWGRKARDLLAEYGPSVFGARIHDQVAAANRWETTAGGGMTTAGVGGPITGRGADLLILDDPIKNAEEARSVSQREKVWDWYKSTAYTRLEPRGSVILVMTRWHRDDLAGRLLDAEGDRWKVLRFPAIAEKEDQLGRQPGEALWPERYPVAKLHEIKSTIEAYWWSCLYQQSPTAEGGTEWPDNYFGPDIWFSEWPVKPAIKTIALDPSKGRDAKFGDYSAFVLLARDTDGVLYCDAVLDRIPSSAIVDQGIELQRTFRADAFAVETNQFQQLLAVELVRISRERALMVPVWEIENMVNKQVRIRRLGPYLVRGGIRFKGGSPGAKLLVQQLRDFPCGDHDDGPDALEMAVRVMIECWNGRIDSRPLRVRS